MKTVIFDDPDPRLVMDNPNLHWGDPSYLLEEGDPGYVELQPGQPGYVPPAPRRKPPRRPAISLESLNLPPNMQPFRYVISLIKGIFTAKPVLRDAMRAGEYLDTLATRSQLTRAQVEKLITEQAALHIELARQGIPVEFILKRFRMQPTCGGRYPSPDPDSTEVGTTLSLSLIVHPDEIDKLRVDCPLEKVGETGELGPEVESVRSRPGNVVLRFGVGLAAGTEVNGDNFRLRRSDAPWPTAELVPVAGGASLSLAVLDCTPTRLVLGGAPAGTAGAYFLKVTDDGGHFTTFDQELTPA
jgi:hypothetical protein